MQTEKIESFKMIGIQVRTSNQDGRAANDIPQLWQTFMSQDIFAKIPNKLEEKVYAVYTEYEGDHNKPYTMILGCKVSNLENIPDEMISKTFAGGNYIEFARQGKLSEIVIDQWMKIWDTDLDRTYDADFEIYDSLFQDPENGKVKIQIGVN